mmetsp:Transcript_4081/g.9117  ORF Transcript_4081/g.9117 Transcript_4081/m.9117 type:complete len:265 (-) Transcript_4081:4-798(-)
MELFPPFFFFPPPSSSESYASAFTLSMAFFLASSTALLASSSSLAFFAAASLLALTSANLAISLLYSSVSPASCLLRYAAAFSSFSFSSRSFLVIGTSSATTAVPRSFIFIMRGFVPPPPPILGFSTSINPSSPFGLYSFSTHSPSSSSSSSPTDMSATRRPTSMASLSNSFCASSTEPLSASSSPPPPSPSSASARRFWRAASNSARRALRCSISSAETAANRLPEPRPPPRLPFPRAMVEKISEKISFCFERWRGVRLFVVR